MAEGVMKIRRRGKVGNFFHWLRYRIGEACLRGFTAVLPWIPETALSAITEMAGRLTFRILWIYKARMERNVLIAMGGKFPSPEARRNLIRRAWRNFARSFQETTRAIYKSKETICSTVSIQGEEHLKRAMAKGKGVVALSAHLGNFMMIGIRLAASGYPYNVIVKQPRDTRFARLLNHYRALVGIKTISAKPRRGAAQQILRVLRQNEIVLIIADEFKSGDIEVEFLGRLAPAPRGPVSLAMRSGAAVLPMFAIRDDQDRLTLMIGEEVSLINTGNVKADVKVNVMFFVRCLETMVSKYPDQWNWMGFPANGGKAKPVTASDHSASSEKEQRISV